VRRPALLIALAAPWFAACPSGDDTPPPANPPRLWLALDRVETAVKLVPEEPEPY
jgi:hypothetical protein